MHFLLGLDLPGQHIEGIFSIIMLMVGGLDGVLHFGLGFLAYM